MATSDEIEIRRHQLVALLAQAIDNLCAERDYAAHGQIEDAWRAVDKARATALDERRWERGVRVIGPLDEPPYARYLRDTPEMLE